MSKESCYKRAKNRVSYVCIRSAELRKGKPKSQSLDEKSFIQANKEYKIMSYKR